MTDHEREAFIAGYKAGRRGLKPKFNIKHKPMFETDIAKLKELSNKITDILSNAIDAIDAKQEAYYEMLMRMGEFKILEDETGIMLKKDIGDDFEEV